MGVERAILNEGLVTSWSKRLVVLKTLALNLRAALFTSIFKLLLYVGVVSVLDLTFGSTGEVNSDFGPLITDFMIVFDEFFIFLIGPVFGLDIRFKLVKISVSYLLACSVVHKGRDHSPWLTILVNEFQDLLVLVWLPWSSLVSLSSGIWFTVVSNGHSALSHIALVLDWLVLEFLLNFLGILANWHFRFGFMVFLLILIPDCNLLQIIKVDRIVSEIFFLIHIVLIILSGLIVTRHFQMMFLIQKIFKTTPFWDFFSLLGWLYLRNNLLMLLVQHLFSLFLCSLLCPFFQCSFVMIGLTGGIWDWVIIPWASTATLFEEGIEVKAEEIVFLVCHSCGIHQIFNKMICREL